MTHRMFALALLLMLPAHVRAGTGERAADPPPIDPSKPVWSLRSASVESLTFSPDGRTLAVATRHALALRSVATLAATTAISWRKPRRLAFTPDSAALLTWDDEEPVAAFDAGTGQTRDVPGLATLFRGAPAELAFSPDGRHVATIGLAYENAVADELMSKGHGRPLSIRYRALVRRVTGTTALLSRWPPADPRPLVATDAKKRPFPASRLAWSPDSTRLLTTGGPGHATWKVPDGTLATPPRLLPWVLGYHDAKSGDGYSFVKHAFYATPEQVVTIGGSGLGHHSPDIELFAFDPRTAKRLWPAGGRGTDILPGERYLVANALACAVQTGAPVFALCQPWEASSTIGVLRSQDGTRATTISHPSVRAIAVSPDGRLVAAASPTRLALYAADTGRERTAVDLGALSLENPILGVAGPHALLGLHDGTVRPFDPATGRTEPPIHKADRYVEHLSVSASGLAFARGVHGGALLDLAAKQVRLPEGAFHSEAHAVSPSGAWLAQGDDSAGLTIFDARTGKPQGGESARKYTGEIVRFVAFAPDEKTAFTLPQWSGTVGVWDVPSGRHAGDLALPGDTRASSNLGHNGHGLVVSPDGKWLAAAIWCGRGVAVFGPRAGPAWTGLPVRFAAAPSGGEPLTIAFSADATRLACGTDDGELHLFDLPTLAHRQTVAAHTDAVLSLAFVQDALGPGLLSSGRDGAVHRWRVPR